MTEHPPLIGFTVGITGHRRSDKQAELLTRRGAKVVHGPTATSRLGVLDATLEATRAVLGAPVDIVVLATGIGTRSWFAAAESAGLDARLREHLTTARVLARGPKALHAARAEGLDVAWAAPGETNDEVIANLIAAGLNGLRVVVQRDGGEPVVARALTDTAAASVIDVPTYHWHVPADAGPAIRLLDQAARVELDAVTFTSAHAVHNAMELAPDPDRLVAALDGPVLACVVGPVTARALRRYGVTELAEPARARLGSMVLELTKQLERRAVVLSHEGAALRWQGSALIAADGAVVELTGSERRLLRAIVHRSPAVIPKLELAEPGTDEHAVESAVARLRIKLGPLAAGIRTVRRRGYGSAMRVDSLTGAAPAR